MSHNLYSKRYGLFALAIALLICGGLALFASVTSSNRFLLRSLGVLACLASVHFVRLSRVHAGSYVTASARNVGAGTPERPRPTLWAFGAVSLIAVGISYFYLYEDAVDGYHELLPVYLFALAMLVCAWVWGYLISKVK